MAKLDWNDQRYLTRDRLLFYPFPFPYSFCKDIKLKLEDIWMGTYLKHNWNNGELITADQLNNLEDITSSVIAPEYNSGITYQVGDYVTQKGVLYRCKASVAGGNFSSANWDLVTVAGQSTNSATMNADIHTSIEEQANSILNNIAPEFSSEGSFVEGDYIIYNGQLYKANKTVQYGSSFSSSDWDAATITGKIGDGYHTMPAVPNIANDLMEAIYVEENNRATNDQTLAWNFAAQYNTFNSYEQDDYVVKDRILYKANKNIPAVTPFSSSDWDTTTITAEINLLENNIYPLLHEEICSIAEQNSYYANMGVSGYRTITVTPATPPASPTIQVSDVLDAPSSYPNIKCLTIPVQENEIYMISAMIPSDLQNSFLWAVVNNNNRVRSSSDSTVTNTLNVSEIVKIPSGGTKLLINYTSSATPVIKLLSINTIINELIGTSLNATTEVYAKATEQIISGKLFIANNKLYKATTEISSGDSIIPNTNCIETSIVEQLNTIYSLLSSQS